MTIMNLQNINIAFGGPQILDNINLQIDDTNKISIIGRNGTGKSTIMKIIEGILPPDSGNIITKDDIKISSLSQDVPTDITGTVYDIIASGINFRENNDHHDEKTYRNNIDRTISQMSLNENDLFQDLSAGMKRRVLLAKAIVIEPDILLLDEPTNHLDINSINWLENFLIKYSKTVVFVTHDRSFLKNVATRIIELDRGNLFDWSCDYTTFLERKDAFLESEDRQRALFDKKLAQEEVWIRKGIKARRTRNEGRVRALESMREEQSQRRYKQGSVNISLQESEKSGKTVIETDNISFSYNNKNEIIINNFSTIIQRGDRIGIIGENGSGKSTLVNLLVGKLEASSGIVKIGSKLDIAYFDQLRDTLDEDKTIKENVTDGNEIITINGKQKHIIGYLQDFLFPVDMINMKVSSLSGGEKNRLLLAKLFTKPSNFIILDEPTNDLDLETIELLEELLFDFNGTVILISHDRSFINNIATRTIVFENSNTPKNFVGGYDDWLIQKKDDKLEKKDKKNSKIKTEKKIKLTFKETKELEDIPEIIENSESRKDELYTLMADPDLYKSNKDSISDIKNELSILESELESLYKRWDELEELNSQTQAG